MSEIRPELHLWVSYLEKKEELEEAQDRIEELEEALDFYACVDHYQTHNAAAPNVVQFDRGAKARAALKGGSDE